MTVTPFAERRYPGEWCKRCDRAVVIGFQVPTETWNAVVRGRWNVVCLPCFDELSMFTIEADLDDEGSPLVRGIDWTTAVELYPTSRAMWAVAA